MKKLVLSILMLFNFSFAGETGYIWIPDANQGLDQAMSEYGIPFAYTKLSSFVYLPNINSKLFIDNKIYIVKKKEYLEEIIKKFRELKKEYLEEIIKKFRELKKEELCELSTFSTLDFYKGNSDSCSFFNEANNLKNKYNEDIIYISNNKLEIKLLDIIRYVEGTFFEIEIINKGEKIND